MWHRNKEPDEISIGWLDEVQNIASPSLFKITRVSRTELHLKVIPNPAHERYLEKKRQKQAAEQAAK